MKINTALLLIIVSLMGILAPLGFDTQRIAQAQTGPCYDSCPADSCTRCAAGSECYVSGNCGAASGGSGIKLENPINATSVPQLVNSIVRSILGMVGALALFMFVYGGMLWMTSAGNTNRIEKGKETLTWATIGLVIIFASYAILSFIFTALSGKAT